MVVFNSMIIVVLVLMYIYKTQVPSLQQRLEQPIPWAYAIIAMGYITFWAALRSGFVDTSAYIRMFNNAPIGFAEAFEQWGHGKSGGFDCLMVLFKTVISSDYHYWLSFIAIGTAIPIMVTFRRYSIDYLYCVFLFISSTLCIWMFNGIRQFWVAAILFSLTYLIKERKFVKYAIVVLICSTIHATALLMLPMYFFVTDRPFGKRMIIFVLAVLSCAITVAPFMDAMESVLQNTDYSHNLTQFAEDDGVNPLRVLLSAVPVILVFFKRKELAKNSNPYIYICVNMATISAGLYFVGMFTSGIMIGRLPAYFRLYTILLIPFIINNLYASNQKIFYAGFTAVYLTFYYLMARNYYYISDILGTYI